MYIILDTIVYCGRGIRFGISDYGLWYVTRDVTVYYYGIEGFSR